MCSGQCRLKRSADRRVILLHALSGMSGPASAVQVTQLEQRHLHG
jgi:hypothetical protein